MMQVKKNQNIVILLIAIVILLLFTRFYKLDKNPGFYGDECCYGEVGYNLIRGKLQYEGLKPTFFSTFMTQPPLLPALAGFLSLILGKSILIVRLISAFAAVASVFIIFYAAKEMGAKKGCYFGMLFFILHPETLLINRYGFTYNLGMFFTVCTFLFAFKYLRTKEFKFIIFASLFAALNLLTVYYSFALVVWLIGFALIFDPKRFYIPVLSVIPFLILIGYFFLFDREIFLFDLKSMMSMASGEKDSLKYLPLKYIKLILMDYFFVICFAGFFLNNLGKKEKWFLGSFFFFASFEILRQREDIFILYYPVVFFVPILFISSSIFIEYILEKLSELIIKFKKDYSDWLIWMISPVYISLIIIAFVFFYEDIKGLSKNFDYQITKLSTSNSRDIQKAVNFLNQNCEKNSLILTSIPVGFFLDCPHASLLQSAAYSGYKSVFYNFPIGRSRFYNDLTYNKAAYLVILNVDRNWTLSVPGVTQIINGIRNERWELVFKQGEVEIYENPLNI